MPSVGVGASIRLGGHKVEGFATDQMGRGLLAGTEYRAYGSMARRTEVDMLPEKTGGRLCKPSVSERQGRGSTGRAYHKRTSQGHRSRCIRIGGTEVGGKGGVAENGSRETSIVFVRTILETDEIEELASSGLGVKGLLYGSLVIVVEFDDRLREFE